MNPRIFFTFLIMAFFLVALGFGIPFLIEENAKFAKEKAEIAEKMRAQEEKSRLEREELKLTLDTSPTSFA